VIVPWTLIDGAESAASVVLKLDAPAHGDTNSTSISAALMFAAGLFVGNTYAGERQVIDVSGDGVNNVGPPVEETRDWVVSQGIAINGLPIVIKEGDSDPDLAAYYRNCVIGGPGAFIITVSEISDFHGNPPKVAARDSGAFGAIAGCCCCC
jgi:hypothetical protein